MDSARAVWEEVTNSVDMSLSKLGEIVKDGEAWGAAGCGVAKSLDTASTLGFFDEPKLFRSGRVWMRRKALGICVFALLLIT